MTEVAYFVRDISKNIIKTLAIIRIAIVKEDVKVDFIPHVRDISEKIQWNFHLLFINYSSTKRKLQEHMILKLSCTNRHVKSCERCSIFIVHQRLPSLWNCYYNNFSRLHGQLVTDVNRICGSLCTMVGVDWPEDGTSCVDSVITIRAKIMCEHTVDGSHLHWNLLCESVVDKYRVCFLILLRELPIISLIIILWSCVLVDYTLNVLFLLFNN